MLQFNNNFDRLIAHLKTQGDAVKQRSEDTAPYKQFIQTYPLERLSQLSLDEYCVGKGGGASFCWWIERGLEQVLGRYMPGTSRGHVMYFRPDGSVYKAGALADLSDEAALRYTLRVQNAIASASPSDMLWVDDDKIVFDRAGVDSRITVGDGRKLRLLACYHPAETLPISSSSHLQHFLKILGCPEGEIPGGGKPVARMLKLRGYFLAAREQVQGLSPYGFVHALYSKELGLAPTKKQATDDSPNTPTYLLTWNPAHFKLGGDSGVALGDDVSWTCHSRKPLPGDRVYLIRLGLEPRGIVASGIVTQGAHEGADWRDSEKTRSYIRFRVEEHRPDCASGLLPMLLLNKALRQQRWNPQGSGVEVPESIAEVLHQLWQSGETKHSLRQYMEWSAADPKESRPVWLKSYKTLADRVRAVREGLEPLDSSLLEQLWLTKDNGVSSLRQGVMARQEFDAQHGVILEMTRSVLAAPTDETFQRVLTRWKEGVQAGDFNMNRPAMIRRVFAACAPERYTTLLKAEDCQQLLQGLESQFQLKASSVASVDSWCEFNRQLKECLSSAQLEELADLESNIALWQMLEAMQGRNAMDECDESQGAQGMISDQVPLNQILFGPPGTGKTFHTVNSALAILAPDVLAENEGDSPVEREVLKDTFDRLVAERQIRFVTFHQSFSYEDFVEGLRAVSSDDGGQPDYRVEPGVFKQICIDAAGDSELGVEAFNAALERLREQVEAAGRLEAQTPRGNRFAFEYVGGEAFRVYPQASQNQGYPYRASVADMLRLYRTGDSSLMHNSSYVQGILQYLRQECDLPDCIASGGSDQSTKKYDLIIDEINRGNVSRIFGELITLIEESKRAGKPEALSAVLPYSKDVFTVPDNVYIIGTMNTADRSLAGLDMALRRRFVFQEMPPRPELLADVDVQGINVGELLKTMNQRIEVLLDRDHCLGHSYFLPLKQDGTLSKLAAIFRSQILPLLQEYFFDDWQRIQWVLNDHRKAAPERFVIMEKPDLDSLFGNIDVAAQGGTWRVNSEAFLREDAYKGVLSTKLLHTEHEGFAAGTGA